MQDSRSRHRDGRAGDFRPSTIAVLFVVLMAVASIPIATHPLPPLSDYVNHLARTYVIDAVDTDPYLARFYEVDWQVIPNLMIDLIVPLLHGFMDVYLAGQIFTILAFVLIGSGTLAFNRALTGRWSALPLIALPLLYNGVLLVGVMNYVFGIGLALWGLAAWIALRERPWPWRLAISTLFALALYFCHLFAAGVYGLGLLAIELHRLWSKRTELLPRRLVDFVATGLPFLPLIALLMTSSTLHAPGAPAYWELDGKLEGLMAVIKVYYPSVAIGFLAIVVIAAAFARWRNALGFHPVGWTIFGVGAVAYLALPRAIFGAHLADQRLPIALAFMLIACFTVELRRRLARVGLVALIALMLTVRIATVQSVWNHLDHGTNEFVESVKSIKRGARVLVVWGDRSSCKEISDFNIVHAASLATIERSALVTTAFTVKGKHILHARKPFRAFVETEDRLPPALPYFLEVADKVPAGIKYFWNLWPRHYDYVYILFTTAKTPNPSRKHLELVYDGDVFDLYRVRAAGEAQGSSAVQ
ncbi:MAG: hypothetical protein HY244_03910 [Rhizobiales bacterium]|nr:hypothetical protein [Hyphomicrobiales bacterium]